MLYRLRFRTYLRLVNFITKKDYYNAHLRVSDYGIKPY